MAVLKKKRKITGKVPTASMADIAFLLVIFFMVTTTFKIDTGLKINLPKAEKIEKLSNKNLAIIWLNDQGRISIEDKFVPITIVSQLMDLKRFETNNLLIVEIKADRNTKYGAIDGVFEQLKKAQALRVVLGARYDVGG